MRGTLNLKIVAGRLLRTLVGIVKSCGRDRPGIAVGAFRTFGLSWPLLVGLAAFLSPAFYDSALRDPDGYWHVAAGRWMLEHGTILRQDQFSYSMPGAPWTAHEWGAEVIMALVQGWAGWAGLLALAAAAFAATLAYLTRFLLRRMEPLHALAFVAVAAAMMVPSLLARPHTLVWPLTALWVGTLLQAAETGRPPPWWLLFPIVLWANLHASFVIALGLGAALAADAVMSVPNGRGRIAGRWGLFLAAAGACGLLNPRGIHAMTFAFEVMRMRTAQALITEWQSPNFEQPQVLLLWLLPLLALAFAGSIRLPPIRSVIVVGLLLMALQHQRNVALLGLVSPFVMARPLAAHWRELRSGQADNEGLDGWFATLAAPARPLTTALCLGLACAVEAALLNARTVQPAREATPQAALDVLLASGAGARILNSYNFGGYLIYRGVPVFIDGRADMYGDAFLAETTDVIELQADRPELEALLAKYRIDATLLRPDIPAVRLLDHLPGWQRIYADTTAVVHVRSEALRGDPRHQ